VPKQGTGIGQEALRRNNMSQLLTGVHLSGPTPRAALTKEMGLNRSTIAGLASALEELGLVSEEPGVVVGRSGRPSLVVVPRADNAVVAVDLGVDRIAVALVALGGEFLERRQRPHQRGRHDVVHVVESVAQMVEDVLGARPTVRCHGVGVAVPGAIRTRDGLVWFAPNLGWVEERFSEILRDRLGLSVATGNDANLGAIAEHLRGVAVGRNDVAYLSGSVGVGGGFLVGGVLLTGASGYAGEVGHLLVDSNGSRCRCGNVGCWETKVGENELLTLAGRLPGGGPQAVAEVIAATAGGEARATAALDEVAEWTGVGLRAVINLFNCEMIVLGGHLAAVFGAREQRINEVLDRWTLMTPRSDVDIVASTLHGDAQLVGAAELAFGPVLADPAAVRPSAEARGTPRAVGH
jgi:predicted NBD/HSP70 family sugar kinase